MYPIRIFKVSTYIYLLRNKNQTLAKNNDRFCLFLSWVPKETKFPKKKIFQTDTFKTLLTVITILYFQSKNQDRKLHFLRNIKYSSFLKED